MFKTVVVGTDGSDTANMAVVAAAELARGEGAVLHIVSSYRPMASRVVQADGEQWQILPEDEVDNVLQQAGARVRMAGVQVEIHSDRRAPADALIHTATEVGADLLVVGNRGMKGAKRFLLGSVPSKVAHNAPCNVLVVKTT